MMLIRYIWQVPLILIFLISCIPNNDQELWGGNRKEDLLISPEENYVEAILWSPNGKNLVISAIHEAGIGSIITIHNLETGHSEVFVDKLDSSQTVIGLALSPTGEQIAFKSDGGRTHEEGIWISGLDDFDGSGFVGDGKDAAWSPKSGLAIYRGGGARNNVQIFIHDLDSGEERLVYDQYAVVISDLSWSPGGSKLAFILKRTTGLLGGVIIILNVIDGEFIQITTGDYHNSVAWSPNRDLIAFTRSYPETRHKVRELHLIRQDGSCEIRIPEVGNVDEITWAPEGERIAFTSYGDVFMVDLVDIFGEEFYRDDWPCPATE